MEKVKVTKEVAEAIELVKPYNTLDQIVKVSALNKWGGDEDDYAECLNSCQLPLNTLITALYIGYEVEESPEDKASEAFLDALKKRRQAHDDEDNDASYFYKGYMTGIRFMAETFDIKVVGVNA